MIPLILHQTSKSSTLSEPTASYANSWRRINPRLKYQLFDDRACREFVNDIFPQYLNTYDSFAFGVQRADFFRYLAVYHFGGIYCDTDMECLRSFDTFFDLRGIVFSVETGISQQRQQELCYRHPFQIANCIFAAERNHPFFLKLIEKIVAIIAMHPQQTLDNVEDLTGPRLLTSLLYAEPPPDLVVLDQIYWMAPSYYSRWPVLKTNVFSCHHFMGSWKNSDDSPSIIRRWVERSPPPWPFPRNKFRHFA
jgi:inositol phosphorylceramide mannosyltransferase catalytic subunit